MIASDRLFDTRRWNFDNGTRIINIPRVSYMYFAMKIPEGSHVLNMLILFAPPHVSAALPVQGMLQPVLPSGAGTPGTSITLSQSNNSEGEQNFCQTRGKYPQHS